MSKSFFYTFFVLACMLASSSTTNAALSPDATNSLLNNADRIMLITVLKVMPRRPTADDYGSEDGCMHYYTVKANVIDVAKQTNMGGLKAGDEFTFDSWYYDYSKPNCHKAGPSSPPLLKSGWCGFVYVNLPASGGDGAYTLAANGESFNKEPQAMCQDPEDNDTGAVPPSDGGSRRLEVGAGGASYLRKN